MCLHFLVYFKDTKDKIFKATRSTNNGVFHKSTYKTNCKIINKFVNNEEGVNRRKNLKKTERRKDKMLRKRRFYPIRCFMFLQLEAHWMK